MPGRIYRSVLMLVVGWGIDLLMPRFVQDIADVVVVAIIVGGALGIVGYLIDSPYRKQEREWERLAVLPEEVPAALANARKATAACLAMSDAAAIVESLDSVVSPGAAPQELKDGDGPSESELLCKTKAVSLEALTQCRHLSIEAVRLTGDARYVALRGFFRAAETACLNCQHQPGLNVCPATNLLKKIFLET